MSHIFKSITCGTSCRSCGSLGAQSLKRLRSKNQNLMVTSHIFISITCGTSCMSCGSSGAQSSKRLQFNIQNIRVTWHILQNLMMTSHILQNLIARSHVFKIITCGTSCMSCGSSDAQSSKRLRSKNLSENPGNRSGGPDDLLSIRTGPPVII